MAYTTINKPSDYFRIKTYTGNATNDTAITFDESTNMKPDWLWIKNRSANQSHAVFDSTRGPLKRISTNSSSAEGTENTNLDSFDTNGFTVDNEAIVNGSGNNMIGWAWKANGGTTSSNSNGNITSTVQANTTSGFSIVKYTGTGSNTTVGHGLGAAPKMILFKNINSTRDWAVYQDNIQSGTPNAYLTLNQTYAKQAGYNFSNATAPTNQVFSVGTLTSNNGSGEEYIAYCFAEIKGYSKFGSYTGNGNADGTFVYTGFKPAFVITKNATDALTSWTISDNKRPGFNVINDTLFTDSSGAEQTFNYIDHLSNGFKLRYTSDSNTNNSNIIYMAFAEQPLVGTNNVVATGG